MASMLLIPIELLSRIFESCDDFPQVIALASACKQTHAAWEKHSGTIVRSVGRAQIRSFDDAFMAVRATAIVLKAYQKKTSQPVIKINTLSGDYRLPEVAELKEVLNMRYLVQCLEWKYFNSDTLSIDDHLFHDVGYYRYPSSYRQFPGSPNEEIQGPISAGFDSMQGMFRKAMNRVLRSPDARRPRIECFRDEFYRAMYRLLLAGAVLAAPYMAPIFQAKENGGKEGFFARHGHEEYKYLYMDWDNASEDGPTRPEDIPYLRRFPVYNFDVDDWSEIGQWRDREYETCFGPFASWIVEDGRKRQRQKPPHPNNPEPDGAEHPEDVGAVRELMLLLVAYDHFDSMLSNPESQRNYEAAYKKKQGNRTVSIVRFGVFQIEQVTMPAAFEDLTSQYLLTSFHPALKGSQGEAIPYQLDIKMRIAWALEGRRRYSRLPIREYPGPPAMLELWRFALKRYLNLGFGSKTFWIPRRNPRESQILWWNEVGGGEIFLNPSWAPVQKYKFGVNSWEVEAP
ncbi:hypothetical protein ONS95_000514 [Cadophora gregata]|uniref:uncharacterized protein n=1 Tax=Cadophora gregata TaxID=51156 RepID=UPI0026DD99AD|nr:uncharacterized protein ONS95_000514 [Cadophora gregata]KAK0125478.1 hypothetical protein ONS96_009316 [Cadophora gregata f. sp. sojae]KAK0128548.1 hypothetical protein ONS95_000514 [Cadophora gregata]